jgi:preprotein translocase subunit SecG
VTAAIVTIHVIAACVLILFILLHAGRGGGLSEMFGGGMTSGGSTVVEKNLDRLTVIMSVVFTITTVALYFRFK